MVDRPPSQGFAIPRIDAISIDSAVSRASLGNVIDDWEDARQEFVKRLDHILSAWNCEESIASLSQQIASYPAPPHTVQRLAELLYEPQKWYTNAAKYVRAIIRVLSVTSTTVDFSEETEATSKANEESLLVPIPWLRPEDVNVSAETTIMPNGITIATTTSSNGIPDHDAYSANTGVTTVTGSAPIDAADYGPQSEQVQETIASNASAHVDEAGVHLPGVVMTNGAHEVKHETTN